MLKFGRNVAAVLAASLVLALGAAVASAEIQVSTTSIRATSAALTFASAEIEAPVVCAVTLAIRLRETRLPSTEGSVIGEVTEARAERCEGGNIRILGPRFVVRLTSFREGLLRLQIDELAALAEVLGGLVRCLFQGNMQATNNADPVTRLNVDETRTLALFRSLGGFGCPRTAFIRGALTTTEVAYTEVAVRGKPLQPTRPLLEFAAREQVKAMEFTNAWIVPIRISGNAVGPGAPRFIEFAAFGECFEVADLGAGGRCQDQIRLFRPREMRELVNVPYDVTLLGLSVGDITLER